MSEAAFSVPAAESSRRIGGIPIRNLYVMLAFADALRDELSAASCGAMAEDPVPLDVLAQLLINKLIWIRRRGTPRSYRVRDDVGASPEGAIDLSGTLRGMHLVHNRLAYLVDELQLDTPHNRLLCAGVRALLRSPQVKDTHAGELRRQLSVLSGVAYISNADALRVEWDRSPGAASSYREALGLARLAVLATLPDEAAHDRHWRKLLDDQQRMGQLFEAFVLGFLQVEFAERGRAHRRNFCWSDPDVDSLLPQLITDIVLELPDGRVAIGECKLYKSPLVQSQHSGTARLRPHHLNQLFAYLCAAQSKYADRKIAGLLIYALVDQPFDTDLKLRQFPVRVRTLDLHLPWPMLREQLRALWPT